MKRIAKLLFVTILSITFLILKTNSVQAAITYVGAGAIGAAANAGADPTAALPASTLQNDILLIHAWTRSTADTTTITGFTEISQVDTATGSHRWFWKRHDGSEGNVTCNRTGTTGDSYCRMFAFRGVIQSGDPWNALGTAASWTSTTDPTTHTGIDTGTTNSMVVVFAGYEDDDASVGVMTGTDPSAYTEVYAESTSGSDGSITLGYAVRSGAGATGTISYNYGTLATLTDNEGSLVLSLAPQNTTTLANGTNPSNDSIGPDGATTDLDTFTFTTDNSTDTIDSLTATLSPSGAYNNISQVDLTDNSNSIKCSVSSLASDTLNFTSCGLAINTSASTYKLRVTPKSHANMPSPNGNSYATTGTITAWTSVNSHTQAGSDSGSATITIDNASPNAATSVSVVAGNTRTILNWTTSNSSDFNTTSGSVVYRWDGSSAGSEVPAENSTPSAGDTNSTATVACVISSSGSTAQTKIDGTGGSSGCTTGALTNGQAYIYKVFQKDTNGNYNTGTSTGPITPTSVCASIISGNWGSGTTWEGCSGSIGQPIAGDNVGITAGTNVTVDSAQAATSVVVSNTATLSFGASSSLILNGTGTVITNNGTLTAGASSNVIVTSPTSPTAILSGSFTGSNAFNNLTLSPTITGNVGYPMGVAFTTSENFTIDPTSSGSNTLTVTLGGTTIVGDTVLVTAESSAASVLDTGTNYSIDTAIINVGAGGTLEANNSTISLFGASSLTVTGGFTAGGSTIVIDGMGTSSLAAITGSITFNNLQIEDVVTVVLANPITINGNLSIIDSVLFDNGNHITGNSTGILSVGANAGLGIDSGLAFGGSETTVSYFPTLFTRNHINLDPGSAVYYASDSTQAISSVPIYGSIYLVGNGTTAKTVSDDTTVTGDWVIDALEPAQFQPGTYTVYLSGADGSTQSIVGSSTFNNLTAITSNNSAGRTILFEAGSTTTVTGTLTLQGDSGKILTLNTTDNTSGTPNWTINANSILADYLNVSYSTNTGDAICATHSTSGGNNSGWSFTTGLVCNSVPNTPTLNLPTDGGTNQSLLPSLQIMATDINSDYLRYQITICKNSGMSIGCQTFTQGATYPQVGWSGQDAESDGSHFTAYASGTTATYTLQSALDTNTTYYWKSVVTDPGGTNTASSTQVSAFSFTTTSSVSIPGGNSQLKGIIFKGLIIK